MSRTQANFAGSDGEDVEGQGMRATSGRRERRNKTWTPPEPPGGTDLLTACLQLSETHFRLRNFRTGRFLICVVLSQ